MSPVTSPLSLKELAKRESCLRLRYIELPDEGEPSGVLETEEARSILLQSLQLLELTLVSSCLMEAASHLGIATGQELSGYSEELLAEVRVMSGLDPLHVVAEHARDRLGRPADVALPRFSRVVYTVKGIVGACPIEELERLANRLSEAPVGHRCRLAYDRLRAFVRRHDPKTQQRIRAVGHAYAQGAVGIRQASDMLGMSTPDLVAVFEELGYARGIDAITLSADDRQKALSALRADRKNRNGQPVYDAQRAARHAIASERIELVDARPWIQHD